MRIFDIENEKDYADLWDILPDEIKTIYKGSNGFPVYYINTPEIDGVIPCPVGLFKINWHDKTEITRPTQEATEADVGKICAFWEDGNTSVVFAELVDIAKDECYKYQAGHESNRYEHCRRLTKQEIEELKQDD